MENWIKNQSETQEINQIDSNNSVTISIKTQIKKIKKIYFLLANKLRFFTLNNLGASHLLTHSVHTFFISIKSKKR